MKIYVVIGSTGEYSDFHEWNVCGYKDEDKAISRVNELNELVASYYNRERDGYEERENITDIIRKHSAIIILNSNLNLLERKLISLEIRF